MSRNYRSTAASTLNVKFDNLLAGEKRDTSRAQQTETADILSHCVLSHSFESPATNLLLAVFLTERVQGLV